MDQESFEKIKQYQQEFEENAISESAPFTISAASDEEAYPLQQMSARAMAKAALRSTFSLSEVIPPEELSLKDIVNIGVSGKVVSTESGPSDSTLTTPSVSIISRLLSASELIKHSKGDRWYMRPEARREALMKVTPGEIAELVSSDLLNSRDVTQRMIATYASGRTPLAKELSYEELSSTLQIEGWLRAIATGIPKREELQYWRGFQEMLIPFRKLTKDFKGRKEELARLTSYVQWLPPSNLADRVRRLADYLFDLNEKPPLVITGMGGIGKSTIVAKFILDHVASENAQGSLPFIYLDFDRPGLSFNEPLTMLLDGARQLSMQMGPAGAAINTFYQTQKQRLSQLAANVASSASSAEEDDSLEQFSKAWKEIDPNLDRTLLMVLDSFEEVQARLGTRLEEVFLFLAKVVSKIPRLRVVISGRWPVSFKNDELVVGDFDQEAAVGYLKAFGVHDAETANLIFKKYGGNPLTLRLAAGVFERDSLSVSFLERIFLNIDQEQRQQELFRRNLAHIRNPRVRRVAMPGLVVRILNREVLQHILAGPCGLGTLTDAQALDLINQISREVNLVEPAPLGEVRYRQALRKKMLPLVASSEPARVRAIHDLAVAFYSGPDASQRAEHLYHRLARGDSIDSVRSLITPDLQPFLQNALDELSPQAHVALASVFRLTVPEEIRLQASLGDYEKLMESYVTQALSSGHVSVMQSMVAQLQERKERSPNSALRRMEARLYERLGEQRKSQELTEVAIEDARQAVDYWGEGEMYLMLARLNERQFKWRSAVSAYRRALAISLQYNFGQFIAAFILHLRLQKRLGNDVRARFSILYDRASRTLSQKEGSELSAANIDRVMRDFSPILPQNLDPELKDVREWLWRALSSDSVLPAQEFESRYRELLSDATPTLESASVGITGAYSRFSGIAGGAPGVQAFDFIVSLERDGRSDQLESFFVSHLQS